MSERQGLAWNSEDLTEVIAQGAHLLRRAMRAPQHCNVRSLVDAGLLELLWCPLESPSAQSRPWLAKDIVRSTLAELPACNEKGEPYTVNEQLHHVHCNFEPSEKCAQCDAHGILARVLLGPMDWFFEREGKEDGKNPLLWVVAKLHDQVAGLNYYRTLSSVDMKSENKKNEELAYSVGQLLIRLPEEDYDWFARHIADLSTWVINSERSREIDYCLICSLELSNTRETELAKHIDVYHAARVMEAVKGWCKRRGGLMKALRALPYSEDTTRAFSRSPLSFSTHSRCRLSDKTDKTQRHLESKAENSGERKELANLDVNDIRFAKTLLSKAKRTLEDHFFKSNHQLEQEGISPEKKDRVVAELSRALKEFEYDLKNMIGPTDNIELPELWKLANYFIWLSCLHPQLGSYTVRYAANYRLMPDDQRGAAGRRDRLQNPCFVIASRTLPSLPVVSAARVALTHCLGPLEDYYAMNRTADDARQTEFHRWLDVKGHEWTKVYKPLVQLLDSSVFHSLSSDGQDLVLDFAREAFIVSDMWAKTGKNDQGLRQCDVTDLDLLKSALKRCCEHAWKFYKIKQYARGLKTSLAEDPQAVEKCRNELEKESIAFDLDEESAIAWLRCASKGWRGEDNRAVDWFSLIVLTVVGNAFKHADPRKQVATVKASFCIETVPIMLLKITNVHHKKRNIQYFDEKYPKGLRSPQKGTFFVLDQCGEALYEAIGMKGAYELSRLCSVTIDRTDAEILLRFPSWAGDEEALTVNKKDATI